MWRTLSAPPASYIDVGQKLRRALVKQQSHTIFAGADYAVKCCCVSCVPPANVSRGGDIKCSKAEAQKYTFCLLLIAFIDGTLSVLLRVLDKW